MSSRQVVFSSAAMAVVVVAGSWLAVSTFPLTEVVAAQGRSGGPGVAAAVGEPGPLERQAKPITPENPIPRRTFSVVPQNPGDDSPGTVVVSLRIVVDRQGRVAEVRSATGSREIAFVGAGRGTRSVMAQTVAPPSPSFVKAAIDAVRQWQYDPPASGPVAFDVAFGFSPGAEPRLLSHGSPSFFGAVSGAINSVTPGILPVPPPPPPPPPPLPPGFEGAVRVGGQIMVPQKVKHVNPVYPPIAQSARVQGVVIVELIIDREGRVADGRVLRSIPLLDQAALDAVAQWEFTPTRLNGTPVPVIMTATVQFTL